MVAAIGSIAFAYNALSPDVPELPPELASKLQVVPGRALLATKLRAKFPPSTQAPPPCAPDATSTYYETRITAPITVCTNLSEVEIVSKVIMPPRVKIGQYKLSRAEQVPGVSTGIFQFPLYCSVSNGPWSASLESDRLCVGTCSPQNELTVTGIPNIVEFFWGGQYNVPPVGADFKFVSPITQIDSADWGRCHANDVTARRTTI